MKITGAKYVAVLSWDGQQWKVRVEDWDYQHRGDTTAARLDQVGPNAQLLLGAQFGCDPDLIQVSVDPEFPEEVEQALQIAEGHVTQAARHVDAAVDALRRANMGGHDIAAILADRVLRAGPQQPLLVPNSEIAAYGLSQRPEVIGVEWPDRQAVVICCRNCVETNPRAWQTHPDGTSAAIYDAAGRCDLCGRDLAGPEGGVSQ